MALGLVCGLAVVITIKTINEVDTHTHTWELLPPM